MSHRLRIAKGEYAVRRASTAVETLRVAYKLDTSRKNNADLKADALFTAYSFQR